jgi:MATE family multidrug resistance protein
MKHSSSMENFRTEVRLFLELAVPTILLSLGFALSPLLTASFIGRKFGATFLSGFTLANLTGNLSTMSVLQGLFSASDTLSPQAYGAGNYKEVGLIAIRGFFASIILLSLINLIVIPFIEPILVTCGQDAEASRYAAQWYRIYSLALPFYALYNATWRFLSSQHVMRPLLYVLFISCAIVLPTGLDIFTRMIGFLGSAVAYSIYQASQTVLLLLYLWWKQPYKASTWPGLMHWRDALAIKPFMSYFLLGVGGMLAQSEWVYWEVQGLIIGTLGVIPLSVHTIPTQVIWVAFMLPYGAGVALSIRMAVTLPRSARQTKALVIGAVAGSCVVFGTSSILMYVYEEYIFAIFTTELEVLEGAHSIWWKVCIYNFNAGVFAIFSGIATGLGMQWTLGVVNCVCLYGIGIPVTYYFALVRGGGIEAAWTWINAPYLCMNITMLVAFVTKDWHRLSAEIRERERMDPETELESQSTYSSSYGSVDEHKLLLI